MPVEFKNFDPTAVVLSIASIPVFGFATGTMINAERNTDSFSLVMGAKGDGTRVRSRDRSGKITFNLMAASSCNAQLTNQVAIDELTGLGYGAMILKYVNGTDIITAANGWLIRPANLSLDTDPSPREWVIECHNMDVAGGGSLV